MSDVLLWAALTGTLIAVVRLDLRVRRLEDQRILVGPPGPPGPAGLCCGGGDDGGCECGCGW